MEMLISTDHNFTMCLGIMDFVIIFLAKIALRSIQDYKWLVAS